MIFTVHSILSKKTLCCCILDNQPDETPRGCAVPLKGPFINRHFCPDFAPFLPFFGFSPSFQGIRSAGLNYLRIGNVKYLLFYDC
jgi:hypothetical protein